MVSVQFAPTQFLQSGRMKNLGRDVALAAPPSSTSTADVSSSLPTESRGVERIMAALRNLAANSAGTAAAPKPIPASGETAHVERLVVGRSILPRPASADQLQQPAEDAPDAPSMQPKPSTPADLIAQLRSPESTAQRQTPKGPLASFAEVPTMMTKEIQKARDAIAEQGGGLQAMQSMMKELAAPAEPSLSITV